MFVLNRLSEQYRRPFMKRLIWMGGALGMCAFGMATTAMAQAFAITVQNVNDATTQGFNVDRISWTDAKGFTRTADMARFATNTVNPGLGRGGYLTRFTYRTGNGDTRTVPITNYKGDGGFGYIVGHLADASAANRNGEDDSPLSSQFANGTAGVKFAGAHHLIYEYTLNYPRWGINYSTTPATTRKYDVPVTIQWHFMTNRDHPIWTVTFDLSAAPAGEVFSDSRSPYGNMAYDGTNGSEAAADVVEGIAWGDAFKFRTSGTAGTQLTLNSPWTWNVANTSNVSYVYQWTRTINAEMGIVATGTRNFVDGGGKGSYFVSQAEPARFVIPTFHNKTSANQPALNNFCPFENPKNYLLPCVNDVWPYQSLANEMVDNNPVRSKKMTWGTMYGFLGASTHRNNNNTASFSGYPKNSYGVSVIFDEKSLTPSEREVAQVAARQAATLTVTNGTVATQVRRGIADSRTAQGPANGADVFATGVYVVDKGASGTLSMTYSASATVNKPVFLIRNWTSPNPPTVLINGALGFITYTSVNTATRELWLTLTSDQPPGQSVSITLNEVTSGASQIISFAAISNRTLQSGIFNVTATSSSGLPVTFSSLSPNICTVTGMAVSMLTTGSCTIRASQAGNATFQAAQNLDRTFTITSACGPITGDCDGDGIPDALEAADGRNPNIRDNDIFSNVRLFVKQQYRDYLGREGDPAGIGFWEGEIVAGRQTRQSMAVAFATSGEYDSTVAPMARLYFGTFLRIPDYAGLLFWTDEFKSGRRTLIQIGEAFVTVPEFVARYGTVSNAQFVSLVYNNLLQRAPDAGGATFWTDQLNGGLTRGTMLTQFTESAEFKGVRQREVSTTEVFAAMLKRAPSQTEFNTWLQALSGVPLSTQVLQVLNSAEYRARFL
jgi:hypothetical protein